MESLIVYAYSNGLLLLWLCDLMNCGQLRLGRFDPVDLWSDDPSTAIPKYSLSVLDYATTALR